MIFTDVWTGLCILLDSGGSSDFRLWRNHLLEIGWTEARTRSRRVNRIAEKYSSRLISSITDSHRTQCFFMLATNIAALVVIQRGGLDAQSLQQMYNTWVFLRLVAVNGFLLITFTLGNLFLVGILSWYMTLMSSLTVIVTIATRGAVGKFSPSAFEMENLATVAASGGPEECSQRKPGVYCYQHVVQSADWAQGPNNSRYGSSAVDSDAGPMLIFCLLVMLLLLGYRSRFVGRNCMAVRGTQHNLWSRLSRACAFLGRQIGSRHRPTVSSLRKHGSYVRNPL